MATTGKRAAKSGNPAVRAQAQSASSVSSFKKRRGGYFQLPSGETVRLYNPGGMAMFIRQGIIPNGLMTIIKEAIDKGEEPDMTKVISEDGQLDTEKVEEILDLVDSVTLQCMIEPKVRSDKFVEADQLANEIPNGFFVGDQIPEDLRDEDKLYVDELTEEDKMFIFQWATGGTTDVEQFRQELGTGMASLQSRLEVVDSPE